MTVEERLAALEERLAEMEEHLALTSVELFGFRCAFTRLIPLVKPTAHELELARQLAFAQAADAIALDEIHADETRVLLATVRKVFEVVSEAVRTNADEQGNAS